MMAFIGELSALANRPLQQKHIHMTWSRPEILAPAGAAVCSYRIPILKTDPQRQKWAESSCWLAGGSRDRPVGPKPFHRLHPLISLGAQVTRRRFSSLSSKGAMSRTLRGAKSERASDRLVMRATQI